MTPDELAELFRDVKLPSDVRKCLEKVCDTPEGDVEARWVHRLVGHYLYDPRQIALRVPAGGGRAAGKSTVVADVVVYRDKKRKEPFIVVEAKQRNAFSTDGVKQAESYSRSLGADFHICSDWITTKYYKTARYID